MDPALEARLRALPLTYAEVGASLSPGLPTGYHHLEVSTALPLTAYDAARERLMTWRVQEGAGLRVTASDARVLPDGVASMHLGPRLLGLRALCRIVEVVEEPDRVGFAYGTLRGHAETGEESFVLSRDGEGATFTVRAFSRPGSALAKAGGPVGRALQGVMARRYLAALRAD